MVYRYSENRDEDSLYYECPACGASFYGGGKALHNKGCAVADQGYAPCVMVLTFGELRRTAFFLTAYPAEPHPRADWAQANVPEEWAEALALGERKTDGTQEA